ncbi:hypothetical protein [Streptomyces violaceorubidus]|uniref:hypothetical protein n=1 Tax=Streptomyces violaceorubidus TaxID=284042 RepID=UPI000690A980|nr:hypothetical protein [Streptomyces violaceorubidus]
MDDELGDGLPRLPEHRGVVGERHLAALQTFDISRLTTHAVALIPKTFVAVSGVGPKEDSNGSGKTSFLIAVSLLLGDPQWRFESTFGRDASGILFRPEAAGVDSAWEMAPATHGYVVGVFASEAEDLADDALTVWVRVGASAPYIQANWTEGVYVADAATDAERAMQADELWKGLSASRLLSAPRMAEELYGNAPRCLSYLDTPLRPAVPSLLDQQLTAMKPAAIGDALIGLSGMTHLVDEESDRRGAALEHAQKLEEVRKQHALKEAEDQVVMEAVRARAAAGAGLEEARRAWQRFVAVSCLVAVRADQELAAKLSDRQAEADEVQGVVGRRRAHLDELKAVTGLEDQVADARQRWSDARQVTEGFRTRRTSADTELAGVRRRMTVLRPKVSLWLGTSLSEAEAALVAVQDRVYGARRHADGARHALEEAHQCLKEVERGRSGGAGQSLEVLEEHGLMGAVGLMDQLQLDEAVRAVWEPRLWPWRDAVVVGAAEAESARVALRVVPGAQVVAADDPAAAAGQWPSGVSGRVRVIGFLRALEERMTSLVDPAAAYDRALSTAVVGGFEVPVAGRAARLALAKAEVEERERVCVEAGKAFEGVQAECQLAETERDAAAAAHEHAGLRDREKELEQVVTEADSKIAEAVGVEARLEEKHREAGIALATHTHRVSAAQEMVKREAERHAAQLKEIAQLERARSQVACPAWLGLWGSSVEEAAALLGAEATTASLPRPARLRREVEESLRVAYEQYGLPNDVADETVEDLRRVGELRADFAQDDTGAIPRVGIDDLAGPLQVRLAGHGERDMVVAAQISAEQDERAKQLAVLEREAEASARTLETLQDMIERHLDGLFGQINDSFDQLDRQRGGYGAKLEVESVRPEGARPWRWEVTPCWKRSPRGKHVPYRTNANGAQVKVFAIQLVLAALLADDEPRGRVLILDELGNSLGEVNRKDMLAALRNVARQRELSILGTCQDSVLVDAADVCDELLWFTHASSTDAYNQPTAFWGYDAHGQRVELTLDWLTAGRDRV